ncbi:MAG: preprotein translocase subunit SecG [Candidatus Falkowbacteria bacterium]
MKIIQIFQMIIAILLMVAILMQNRGSGLSGIFGGGSDVFRTKRGMEKVLFNSTIVLAVLFFLISLTSIVYKG